MDARIFICALVTVVGSSILTAPARAQDGDRIEEILPAGVGLFEFQSITLQEFIAFIDEGQGVIRVHNFSAARTAPEPARRLLKTTLNIKNGNSIIVGGATIDERTYAVIVKAEVME